MTKAHVAKRKSFPFGHFRRPPTPPTPPPMFLLMASSADCDLQRSKPSLNLPPKLKTRVRAHPRRCPSLPLPVDEDPLATVPAVAVVATVAGLYVVPPLEAQTAPLRCKGRECRYSVKKKGETLK